jgi:hypothetical protein
MKQLTKIYRIRFSEIQQKTLNELSKYNVNIPIFIRSAIKEKIQKEWPNIKDDYSKIYLPF